METDTQAQSMKSIQPTGKSTEPGCDTCMECGHRVNSSAERLQVGDCSFMCDQCYKRLSFPESVTRCCE